MDGQGDDGETTPEGGRRRALADGGNDPLEEPAGEDTSASGADATDAGGNGGPEGGGEGGAGDGGTVAGGFPLSRRQTLAGGGLVVAIGLGLGASHVLRPAGAVSPEFPRDEMEENGWVEVEQVSEPVMQSSAGPITIEAIANIVRFEDQGLVEEIKDREITLEYRGTSTTERLGDHTTGQFDQSMGVFAATKIDLTPHIDELPAGIGRAEVMGQVETQAQNQFEQQLEDAGLENPRQVDSGTFEVETGQTGSLYEYLATFSFESASFETQGVPITVPGGTIDVAGHLAVWHDGSNIVVAAGGHPAENYTDTVTESVQGGELTVDLDLGLNPSELRREIRSYMAQVE